MDTGTATYLTYNAELRSTGWRYLTSDYATTYGQYSGRHVFRQASSGSGGSAFTFTTVFEIDASQRMICPGVYTTYVPSTPRSVYVDSNGYVGYYSSFRASKTNIESLSDVSWLLNLNAVSYNRRKKDEQENYTDEFYNNTEYGLIAEEAESINKNIVFHDVVDGEKVVRGVHYEQLITPMLKLIQDQQSQIESLKAELAEIKAKI